MNSRRRCGLGLRSIAGAAPEEALQALGTDLVEGEGLVSYSAMLQNNARKNFCGWAGQPLPLHGVQRLSRDGSDLL